MIYHVLPGDSVAQEFEKCGAEGRPIVCRECLVVGPVDAPTPEEFWDERAAFILAEYGEDEIGYRDMVAGELERLSDINDGDEVNLWFEYELFCSVNLWFCLSLLENSGAEIYCVRPSLLAFEDRWDGFGGFSADDLKKCFDARVRLAEADIRVGADLWRAFSRRSTADLTKTSAEASGEAFPYLDEVIAAAEDVDQQPTDIVREIMSTGKKDLTEIFPEFRSRGAVFGLGDLQVQRIIDRLSSAS